MASWSCSSRCRPRRQRAHRASTPNCTGSCACGGGWAGEIPATDELLARLAPALGAQPSPTDLDAALVTALARIANSADPAPGVDGPEAAGRLARLFDPAVAGATRRGALARLLRLGAVDLDSLAALTGSRPLHDGPPRPTRRRYRFASPVAWKAAKAAPLKIAPTSTGWSATRTRAARQDLSPPQRRGCAGCARCATRSPASTSSRHRPGGRPASTQATMALVYDRRWWGASSTARRQHLLRQPFATRRGGPPRQAHRRGARPRVRPVSQAPHPRRHPLATTRDALHAAADSLVLADMDEITAQADLDAYVAAEAGRDRPARRGSPTGRVRRQYPELGAVLDAAVDAADPSRRARRPRRRPPELGTAEGHRAARAALSTQPSGRRGRSSAP